MRRLALLAPCSLLLGMVLGLPDVPRAAAEDEVDKQFERIEKNAREPFEQRQREAALRALGRIGGAGAAEALLPLFDDPFVHIRDHTLSAWIKMLGGAKAAETQTWLSTKGLRNRNPRVRAAIWTALGVTGGAELADTFRAAAKREKDGDVLTALARAAVRLRGMPDLAGVFPPRLSHKSGPACLALALAAARYDGAACTAALSKQLKHRAPLARAGAVLALQELDGLTPEGVRLVLRDKAIEPRIALADALWKRTQALPWPGAGEPVLAALLADTSWRVRAAAVQGALRLWDPGIMPLLIERLGAESGRVQEDIQRALETFTGHTVAMDPDLWRAWWRSQQDRFEAGAAPKRDQGGRVPFRDGVDRPEEAGATVAFFNLPLYSQRIVFVFDLSGSFRNKAFDGDDAPTKLELLQAEMASTLARLGPDTWFDLAVYRYPSAYPPKPRMERAFGKLKPADKGTIKKARAWLDKQYAKGWGAFVEPLELLMEEDVDTAVLLSDGRPSRGRYDRDWRILQELPRPNRFRYLAVNTVLIGDKGADRKFMERLAELTGGRFRASVPKR